ncbi:MAG: hypothetical protein IT323_06220 [Anaerolineae bacterium]|nr:hypothetical protein [Anaerolineae bacterium]
MINFKPPLVALAQWILVELEDEFLGIILRTLKRVVHSSVHAFMFHSISSDYLLQLLGSVLQTDHREAKQT